MDLPVDGVCINSPKTRLISLIGCETLTECSGSQLAKLLIRLGLASRCLTNMLVMTSSVSLIIFMSYLIDGAKHGEITNVRSSKCIDYYY